MKQANIQNVPWRLNILITGIYNGDSHAHYTRWSYVDQTNIQDAEQSRPVMMRIIGDLIILTPVIPTLSDS